MLNLRGIMNVALAMISVGVMTCNAGELNVVEDTKTFTTQEVAEFAAEYEHGNDDYDEITVDFIEEDYDERMGGETISFMVYEDGNAKYHHTINRGYYESVMRHTTEE